MGDSRRMSALDVIRRVELLGGKLVLEGDQLKLRAPEPLPERVVADVSREKAAIVVALGAPLDTVVSGVLKEIRPNLPASLRGLPDDKILVLVNWSIIAAWGTAMRKAGG